MKKDNYRNAYLAPLNYDRFFKKAFSDKKIAKKFIEDFLDIEIQEIEELDKKKKVTDDAQVVEFDYFCKIDNQHVIVDMQQWRKHDIVYRFYLYHCMATVLQLEDLPLKEVFSVKKGELIKIKDYSTLTPVITIIWLVEDELNSNEDYLSFSMFPENIKSFFEQTEIWKNKDIANKVKEIAESINNDNGDLQFLQKNRLIFAIQKNIVRNNKISRYLPWFRIAAKSREMDNKKSDFDEFRKDEILLELMRRLLRSNLHDTDLEYIKSEQETRENIERYNKSMRKQGIRIGIKQEKAKNKKILLQAEKEKEQAEKEKKQAEKEKEQAEKEKKQAEQDKKQAEQDKKQAEQDKEQAEQDKEQAEKKRKQAEQDKEQAEKEKKQENLEKNIYKLIFNGKSKTEISKKIKIDIEKINEILNS